MTPSLAVLSISFDFSKISSLQDARSRGPGTGLVDRPCKGDHAGRDDGQKQIVGRADRE